MFEFIQLHIFPIEYSDTTNANWLSVFFCLILLFFDFKVTIKLLSNQKRQFMIRTLLLSLSLSLISPYLISCNIISCLLHFSIALLLSNSLLLSSLKTVKIFYFKANYYLESGTFAENYYSNNKHSNNYSVVLFGHLEQNTRNSSTN